jgi:hypothetical protein
VCKDLKSSPTNKIELKHRLMGIRAEESARRALRETLTTRFLPVP